MNVYFDRTAPLYIVRDPSFDAIPVTVPTSTVEYVERVAKIIKTLEAAIDIASAPETSAQDLADLLSDLVGGDNGD